MGTVNKGELKVGEAVSASIDVERRKLIMPNHTSTHLVNHALREKLGTTVDQKGMAGLLLSLSFAYISSC